MMDWLWRLALAAAESGRIPDSWIRQGIRRLCAERLAEERSRGEGLDAFAAKLQSGPVAPAPEKANEQHYELPAGFYELTLGQRLKYSCCYWPAGVDSLDQAEEAALEETARRADLADGQQILELGCGWGSLSLWLAERYPASRIVAVSNSHLQREYIEARSRERGLANLRVVTADMNQFSIEQRFDRVVSVEMFEHMRNLGELLRRIANWLRPSGSLFVHIFCHRRYAYLFETSAATHWLGAHFFTGGMMPGLELLDRFDRDFEMTQRWTWDGTHYQRTARAWLENMDRRRGQVLAVFSSFYGPSEAALWLQRWRIFFMACEELWGYRQGREWLVGHYRLQPRSAPANPSKIDASLTEGRDAVVDTAVENPTNG